MPEDSNDTSTTEPQPTDVSVQDYPSWFRRSVSLFALSGFAVAQPLFGLIGAEPEFWVARDAGYLDLLVLVIGVVAVIPGTLLVAEYVVSRFHERVSWYLHLAFVAGLSALVGVDILDTVTGGDVRGLYLMVAAALVGIGLAAVYLRSKSLRDFVSILAIGPVVFTLLLVFSVPSLGAPDAATVDASIDSETSVVVVVLDEFQLASIQNADGTIDDSRFPNIARLAERSTWYPYATTVHDNTLKAVPAILTGSYPNPDFVATAADYPVNLFTILGESHTMRVSEDVTQLCPVSLCADTDSDESLGTHLFTLVSDTAVVYLHTVTPTTLRYRLPPIGTRWEGFLVDDGAPSGTTAVPADLGEYERKFSAQTNGDKRAVGYGRFLDSFDPALGPTLYYAHVDLPHAPWSTLPGGAWYPYSDLIPGQSPQGVWTGDHWYVQQAYQRFQLNVGYVDVLVGATLDRLDELGMFDDSLIVFVSDHGENFAINESRRAITDVSLAAVGGIPLFVKYPGQTEPVLSQANAQTVDIVPTVVAALGGSVTGFDGAVLDGSLPSDKRILTNAGSEYVLAHQDYVALADEHRAEMLGLLPAGSGFQGVFTSAGPRPDLNGVPISSFDIVERQGAVELPAQSFVTNFDSSASMDPVGVPAVISFGNAEDRTEHFAIAVNGIIRTTITAYLADGGSVTLYAVVPQGSFAHGSNEVEVFGIGGSTNEPVLVRYSR